MVLTLMKLNTSTLLMTVPVYSEQRRSLIEMIQFYSALTFSSSPDLSSCVSHVTCLMSRYDGDHTPSVSHDVTRGTDSKQSREAQVRGGVTPPRGDQSG